MSSKRTRAAFEADLQAQQSPYVLFGTPLPPLDPDVRDDGSYVPVWKQEVRDERGRKRLHGAFTGGWSAGYFNTVGSKEGWTPSTFVSSRANRRKDDAAAGGKQQQRPEDFMDEEDLADAAEAQKLQTAQDFAGLGSADEDAFTRRGGGLADLFRVQGETMGVKLLKRMGWKDGQGIGPKIRRKARLDVGSGKPGAAQGGGETYLFAPENVSLISFVRKLDRKGLGYEGEVRLTPMRPSTQTEAGSSSDEDSRNGPLIRPNALKKNKKPSKFGKGGIGIGVLNDTGSDDEDPYEIGPRISYNRVIGGDKKKKKTANTTSVNPTLRSAPVFISRKNALAQAGKNLRKCHDGRLPLDGFVFGAETDDLASVINAEVKKYPPPEIPPGWKSSKQKQKAEETNPTEAAASNYVSTADAAKASKLDPKSRAALLGEAQLPGKSVFDFLSASARDRLAAATGKSNLPPALGEVPKEYALSEAERQQELLRQVPPLDKATAVAAIVRGGPYADDEAKRARYRAYLEWAAGLSTNPPAMLPGTKSEDWLRELHEFRSCALIFKPMTGAMASRFTTSSSSSKLAAGSSGSVSSDQDLLRSATQKPADPAEEAAKLGMYGSMTRSVADFYPTRLLCKRFNVRPPTHVQPDQQEAADTGLATAATKGSANVFSATGASAGSFGGGAMTLDELLKEAQTQTQGTVSSAPKAIEAPPPQQQQQKAAEAMVNAEVNEALEGKRAQDDVLKAIFGDSSDEED
ncbi:DUF1604-domain-containing protein [Hypomontagnella monticulosa]|nr:DUF1604-domain-containing protein [Hypomontagnella monticulosa]